jgi:dTDP-4-amino-4,6-dideoxygalactose transaminase
VFNLVEKFESEIAKYYGSPYAVATDSCTHAIELCLRYQKISHATTPKHTYISIPFTFEKLDIEWDWTDQEWKDYYFIGNTNIVDAAVLWKKDGYIENTMMCLSFQHKKHLKLGRGGMILCDDGNARQALKRMSYDGRSFDSPWMEQNIKTLGYHYYMTPETAKNGLDVLPEAKRTTPRSWDWNDYPDLSKMDVFK